MKAYILSIAGILILSSVITILSPSGKMKPMIQSATRLACVFVLISPFAQINQFNFSDFNISTVDEGYLQTCISLAQEQESQIITQKIKNLYGQDCFVSVTCEGESPFSVKKIQIKIEHSSIISQREHIDIIDKIKAWLAANYSCEQEVLCDECVEKTLTG